jgi:hypothetical protein
MSASTARADEAMTFLDGIGFPKPMTKELNNLLN